MRRSAWRRVLLWPLSLVYALGLRLRALAFRRGWLGVRRLPGTVISVGNLTVGGTGKTPMVLRLAAWLGGRGLHVAILTRGYGRRERLPLVINGQGETKHYTPELMGDEPILLARRLPEVTIGIGADRYAVGQQIVQMEAPHPPVVFLLDDGFQHRRLARDLDVVLVDARQPFDGGALLPAGGLREPVAALGRADVIVLTRAEDAPAAGVLEAIRRLNPRAPVFRATTRLLDALDPTTHRPANLYVLKQQPALAFCGVGNPAAFWDDLERWGFNVVGTKAFPDHHRYRVEDFKDLMKEAGHVGARALLTTEKDAVNFTVIVPSHPPTFYCRIELALEDEPGFFADLAQRLQAAAAG